MIPAKYPDNKEIADHSRDVNKNIPLKRDTLFVNRIFLSSKLKFKVANKIWENLDLSLESRSQKQKGKPEARKISCKKDTDCIKPNSQRKYKCVEGFCKLSEMRATIDEKNNTIRNFTNS